MQGTMLPQSESPFLTAMSTFVLMTALFVIGKLRDFLGGAVKRHTKQGYAPIRELAEDFYQRRLFSRIKDCWNRPICSAPGPWVDVMDRTDITRTSGLKPLELRGTSTRCLNLGSYNYLGFAASDPYCTPRVVETLDKLGVSQCSARIDGGHTPVHQELEEAVAKFMGVEAAITIGMGFATNSAVIPVLCGKGDLIISDTLNHSSIVSGARAAGCKVKVFKHNNVQHLEAVLRSSIAEGQPRTHLRWRKIVIIVEGIYSMEGEVCLLKEIIEIKKKYKAYLYLDEAHSIGAMGKTGRGMVEHAGVDPKDVDILMGTFTKSFGSCGGYIAGTKAVVDFLRQHGPAHLYATAMSPSAVQQVLSALYLLDNKDGSGRGPQKISALHANANYMRQRLKDMGLAVLGDWDSPVMPIMIYQPGKISGFSRLCYERHVAMVVVGFPATPLLLCRARVCISAAHSQQDMDYALDVIEDVSDYCQMKYKLDTFASLEGGLRARSLQKASNKGRRNLMSTGIMLAQ